MIVTLLGMVIEVKLLHPANALSPMLVTLLGMFVFEQPLSKVLVSVSIIALQLFRLSYTLFPFSTVIKVKLLQPENAELPMLVTLLGMVIEVKLLQPENAEPPILVTLLGMLIEVKLLQL